MTGANMSYEMHAVLVQIELLCSLETPPQLINLKDGVAKCETTLKISSIRTTS